LTALKKAKGIGAAGDPDRSADHSCALFAALSMLDGRVIGDCLPRHRHQEFIRFLKKIDVETLQGLYLVSSEPT